ncbi:PASTA domain protein [compost metagenome]
MSNTNNPVQLFSELLGSPLGELISSVGQGVGDAQAALDQGALEQTLDIYDISKDEERTEDELKLLSLIREIGYQPTFYTIPETEVEAQISLSLDLKSQQSSPIGGSPLSKYKINATPLNAGNVNRFGLQANAMAKLKFKIVPVPPPQNISEIRNVPDLSGKTWNEERKETIQNLGFTYELRTMYGDLITNEELVEGLTILDQIPEFGTVVNTTNTILTLQFAEIRVIPDLSGKTWNEETKTIILQNHGVNYELRTSDGTVITDETVVEGLPIGLQAPPGATFVNVADTVLVLTFPTIRVVPDLSIGDWSVAKRELLQDLGFTYELRNLDGTLITDETIAMEHSSVSQTPEAGTFANTASTVVVVRFSI